MSGTMRICVQQFGSPSKKIADYIYARQVGYVYCRQVAHELMLKEAGVAVS